MRKRLASLLLLCILLACKERKPGPSAGGDMDAASFMTIFPKIEIPYRLTDSMLSIDPGDSLRIKADLVGRFVPDTAMKSDFPRSARVLYHALGAYTAEGTETYLIVRASSADKTVAYLLCFDGKPSFRVSKPVVKLPAPKGGSEMLLDKNLSIHLYSGRRAPGRGGEVKRDVFVYNSAGDFTLVMTENPNQSEGDRVVENPIDTLPMKDPMSGNYIQDDRNFVAVRDADQKGRLHFFIHIERDGGECSGELRGEMDVVKAGLARYSKADDHCSLDFEIKSGVLTVKELTACGNRRSVRCAFEGSYRKRKPQGRKGKET